MPDPRGRHQHRYWDGTTWTDQVSDNGITSVDLLDGSAATDSAPTAQFAAYQAAPPQRPPRKKWPWIVGGIVLVFVLGIGGCAVLVGTAVNNAANNLNAEQNAHAITPAQFDFVPIGASEGAVLSGLGKQPENVQEFESKGVLSQQNISSSCIYYNKAGGTFGDIYQFCFTNGALDAKNSY